MMALSQGMFGRFNAPTGLYYSARGFNPGDPAKPRRALKGCQTNTVRTCVYQRLSCNHLSPFQGESLEGIFPGVETLG